MRLRVTDIGADILTAGLRAAVTGAERAANLTLAAAAATTGTALLGGDVVTGMVKTVRDAPPDLGAVSRAAIGMAVEALGGPPARRSGASGSRRWIEVRGLDGSNRSAVASGVLGAVRATPGVRTASLNRRLARLVVTVDARGPSSADLCRIVADAERRAGAVDRPKPTSLPGDDAVLVARTAAAAAATAGLGLSLAGTALRLPGLPDLFSVPSALFDYVPQLRREIDKRLGPEGADLLFGMVNATTAALTVAPTTAAAEAATRAMLAVEAWNGRLAWLRHEPELADHPCPDDADDVVPVRLSEPRDGPGEHYAGRVVAAGLGAGAVLGAWTRRADTTGAATLVSIPKPLRASREAFGCALSRGLAAQHDALVLRPRTLRTLDRIDAFVIDPRALYTDELMVSRVKGVENSRRTHAWEAARAALVRDGLIPGWHKLSDIADAGTTGEALVSAVRDPFATAVVSEARDGQRRVVSLADDGLRSLTKGFDHLQPVDGSIDDALAAAVADLKADGATVALLTTSDIPEIADVTIGLSRHGYPPPWGADVLVDDLSGAWRLLHALPSARSATDRGIRVSASASAIGAMMLVPGVVGHGPASVNLGVAAGLWAGFSAGNRVFRDSAPQPEPSHDWHSLPVPEVQRLLPRPPDELPAAPVPALGRLTAAPPTRALVRAASGSWRLARDFVAEMRGDLADPITTILATGAAASALVGSPLDAALVGGVLLANATLSAEQQLHAERILNRLLAVQDPLARRRIGPLDSQRTEMVAAGRLRPGDIIEARAGEVVPADARLIHSSSVEVDESTLTGESLPVAKQTEATPGAPLAERACMLCAGSTIVAGTAVAVVTAVGSNTEMRRAMAMAPAKSREIGLQRQLRRITRRVLPFSIAGGASVGLLSALRGTPLRESVASAVSVIVAAVPEGLPLVVTLAQSAAARRLTDKSVLIRNPHSIEALARLDVVCFDKTGTLSENRLEVKSIRPLEGSTAGSVLDAAMSTAYTHLTHRVEHATDDAIQRAAENPSWHHDGWQPAPRPTRQAFLPFQSGRPFAAALVGTRLTIKGAPEVLSDALTDDSHAFSQTIGEMAAEGLRVLAVAERELLPDEAHAAATDSEEFERLCRDGLTPIGLVGLADIARPHSRDVLARLGERGIGVRLITGDHPVTAAAIANDLGLAISSEEVITGSEWESLSADERAEVVISRTVFARMSPEHKIEVVQTLERLELVTAMVGDGANDAAAIRAASVGIGVAARGSDPARTAADVVLLDGRIEALLDALDEGQQLWLSVQSAVSMLLGGNAGEVAFALVTSLLTGRSVLNARQMLLVNMLTDALPAAALAVSRQDGTGQVDFDEAAMWRAIAIRGGSTTVGASLAWLMASVTGPPRRAATVALIGLVSTQLAQTLVDSHGGLVVLTTAGSFAVLAGVVNTPGISQLFGCTPVGPLGWGQAFLSTAVATALSALAPDLLARASTAAHKALLTPGENEDVSLLDDEDADPNQDGVDLP